MVHDPEDALLIAARTVLLGETVAGGNVRTEAVEEGVPRPYLLLTVQAGGERNNWYKTRDPQFVLTVRCVADEGRIAAQGRQEALVILDRSGVNQKDTGYLDTDDWYISATEVTSLLRMPPYIVDNVRRYDYGFLMMVKMFPKGVT